MYINMGLCTGCRACEVACSYHHTKAFNPQQSSVRILRNNANGKIAYSLAESCDLCKGEKIPMCVDFCAPRAIATEAGGRGFEEMVISGPARPSNLS